MANPTTNYGWPMPTSADLVTDLPADFALFGQPVDTSLKALNPETTLGDIAYRSSTSNTNTRLGIGTNGQVLAVSGGVPAWTTTADVTPLTTKGDLFTFTTVDARLGVGTNGQTLVADSTASTGLKWATPAGGGGFTLINRTSFSNVASTTTSFDGVFTSTYETYYVVVESIGCGSPYTDDMQLQMRYAGPTTQITNYFAMSYGAKYDATALTFQGVTAGAQITLWNNVGGAGYLSQGIITVTNVGNGSRRALISGYAVNGDGHYGPSNFGGTCDDSRAYTGFLLKSSSTNITGTVSVYGLAIA